MAKRIPNTQTGSLSDHQYGTNDTLTASSGGELFGDAEQMHDNSRGGNDTLIGGDASNNFLFGDALDMTDNFRRRQRHADRGR